MFKPPILELGQEFYTAVKPAAFKTAVLRYADHELAKALQLNFTDDQAWEQAFHRFEPIPNNLPETLALKYHGHQFRNYNPDIGDGRGFLYAQIKMNKKIFDLSTKGSGQTPFSRSGDGRLTLKGAFREALCTLMLTGSGVNTSKTLSFFETGEDLERNDEPSPTRAAVLTRVMHSSIRIGTFERFVYEKKPDEIKKLVEYTETNYFQNWNELQNLKTSFFPPGNTFASFYQSSTILIIRTLAEWMLAGFVHGVLNTDNINVTGESFDYGPYLFLPTYDPSFTAAYFDQQGLYSYGRQPESIYWNLRSLGEVLNFADSNFDHGLTLGQFEKIFNHFIEEKLLRRLNLLSRDKKENLLLVQLFFEFLESSQAPFEQVFFDLHSARRGKEELSQNKTFYTDEKFSELKEHLTRFKAADESINNHPYFLQNIAETLLIEEIESLWSEIANKDNWKPFEEKVRRLKNKPT